MTSDETEAHMWLAGDSRNLIVAGSNAVAAVLTFACYHLAQNPTCATKLRGELAPLQDTSGAFNQRTLQTNAPYLNAFLNEIMRLHPPNASGSLRQTPPEGIQIGDQLIPGDVVLCVPHWTLNRCKYSICILDSLVLIHFSP
jgi:cytochrome P450 family 628